MAKRICHLNGWGVVLTPSEEYEREHRGVLHALSRQVHRDIIADVEATDSRLPSLPCRVRWTAEWLCVRKGPENIRQDVLAD